MARAHSHSPHLLEASKYVADLTDKITHAKTRITIMSLVFIDDRSTHTLVTALLAAANRGVVVSIAADAFTYGELDGFFGPLHLFKTPGRKTTALATQFKQAGAAFVWLGDVYKFNPFGGVTHIKWSVVDDISYVFGGTNLYKHGIASADYMFRIADASLAADIVHQHACIVEHSTLPSAYSGHQAACSIGTLYVDSGARRESLIYDRVCELAARAEHILLVSQYCPSGPLARLLKKTSSELYFNPPRNASFPNTILIRWDMLRENMATRYTRKKYLHAKFIIFTLADGQKIAITGSHNFSHAGVVFGTREVALETKDPAVIQQLESFFEQHIQ